MGNILVREGDPQPTKSGKKNEPDIKMHDIQKTITLEDLTNPDKK